MNKIQQKLSEAERKQSKARCLDPDWVYVPSAATDITKTWRQFGWKPLAERSSEHEGCKPLAEQTKGEK